MAYSDSSYFFTPESIIKCLKTTFPGEKYLRKKERNYENTVLITKKVVLASSSTFTPYWVTFLSSLYPKTIQMIPHTPYNCAIISNPHLGPNLAPARVVRHLRY